MERAGALSLMAGTLAMIGVMALHPTGIPHGADTRPTLMLSLAVHGAAIAAAPVLTLGFFALYRSIGIANPVAALGFFVYLFGALAVMLAATMSGLVAPRLIELRLQPGADEALVHGLLRFEWYLNQSFAALHVGFFSAAIALFAAAWPERGLLATTIQIVGVLVGIGLLAWQFSGTLTLDVHGMGAVVIAHGVWIVLAAFGLFNRKPSD